MKVYKRKFLKDNVRLNVLAKRSGITPVYLSKIINNHIVPSNELAQTLAEQANVLSFQEGYFTAADFIPKITIKVTEQ
jgi:transcriptional regulator with XRE-family HTH domain